MKDFINLLVGEKLSKEDILLSVEFVLLILASIVIVNLVESL